MTLVNQHQFSANFVFVLPGGFLAVRLFPDLLVMVVRGGDGAYVWVVAMGFGCRGFD